ncbi:MAG: penicillin-binding protein 2 [Candidatus Andersenbacteria bacterium]
MDVISHIEHSSNSRGGARRFGFLYILLLASIAALLGRGLYLQLWSGSRFLAAAEGNRVAIVPVQAPRGIIYDRYEKQLVENIASTDVVIDPLLLPSEEYEAPLIELLPQYITVTPQQIQSALAEARRTRQAVVLARSLDHDIVLKIEEVADTLPGIRLVSSAIRKYPYEHATAHLIGYTNSVTAEELLAREELLSTDNTGKTGVEKQYDQQLHGTHGATYREVDAAGHPQKELGQEPPTGGATVKLGIDIELQEYIYHLLEDNNNARVSKNEPPLLSSVVAIDPRSGSVRALVNYPSYDPNIFSQPSLSQETAAVFKDEQKPLFNRSVDGEYAPGSTIKPLLAAAALEEGVITAATTVVSSGGITVGPWSFPDWKAGGHGVTDVTKAIAESVNTFFYLLSGGDDTHEGLGVKRATKYLADLGWGKPTGIDLPSEADGFLPSPQWKEEIKKERWYIGDTYHLGIGQGDVLATPLQLALSTAALANGGWYHTPRVVESITPSNQAPIATKDKSRRVPINAQNLEIVRQGMRRTVQEGSGVSLSGLPLAIAGKTGTAQIGGTENTHAWFTSFAPYESPELVLVVLLEKGGAGDRDAVPVAKNIWQWWLEHRRPK